MSSDNPSDEKNQLAICELIFRLRKELAFFTGANNMIRTLNEQKKFDAESTKRAFETRAQAEEKIDLIRLALKKYSQPSQSTSLHLPQSQMDLAFSVNSQKMELTGYSIFDATCSHKTLKHKPLQLISGQLTITLIGCGELVSKVEGREYSWSSVSGSLEATSLAASKYNRKRLNWSMSPNKTYSLACRFPPVVCSVFPPHSPVSSLSTYQNASFSSQPEVFALMKVDSHVAATTTAKPMSSHCWDERFYLELEQNRELEIEIFYKDARSMCAFHVLRLDDLVESSVPVNRTLNLEPQGLLYVTINFMECFSTGSSFQKMQRTYHSEERAHSSLFSSFRYFATPNRRDSQHMSRRSNMEVKHLIGFFQRAFSGERRRNNNAGNTRSSADTRPTRNFKFFRPFSSNNMKDHNSAMVIP